MYKVFIIFIISQTVNSLPKKNETSSESGSSNGLTSSDYEEGDPYPLTPKPIAAKVMINKTIIDAMKYFIPNLSYKRKKGYMGKVVVIGGSKENSGSPYLAAVAALRTGADMAYIFCPKNAATAIKAYSPEVMVHPYLDLDNAVDYIKPWMKSVSAVIIGPGLGLPSKRIQKNIVEIVRLKANNWLAPVPLIIDAEAFSILYNFTHLIENYPGQVYLTPNKYEFTVFAAYIFNVHRYEIEPKKHLRTLAEHFKRQTLIVMKGRRDKLAHDNVIITNLAESSQRRTNGQGDLLSGCLAVFASWIYKVPYEEFGPMSPELVAALSASTVIKLANKLAFKKKGRSMMTIDMLDKIQNAYQMLFHSKTVPKI